MRKRIATAVTLIGLTISTTAQTSVIQPKELDARLREKGGERPAILYVGFAAGFRAGHIPGAVLAGPAESVEGLKTLKTVAMSLPRDREVVVYCGCCPWESCPNIRPALTALREMGFTRVKALVLQNNFAADWVAPGYPVEPLPPRP
jgi:thiosulfate/3-mercaptopyruvate sulfurtransferase